MHHVHDTLKSNKINGFYTTIVAIIYIVLRAGTSEYVGPVHPGTPKE